MLRLSQPRLQLSDGTRAHPVTLGDLTQNDSVKPSDSSSLPKISFESNTPAGKLTITDIQVGSAFSKLVTTGHYALENFKEKVGIRSFNESDARELLAMGVLGSPHWTSIPSSESCTAVQYHSLRNTRAVAGGLSYRIPGFESFPLLKSSSAIQALAALTAIGTLNGNFENTVSSVVDGAINGVYGLQSLPGFPDLEYAHKRLCRFLRDIYSASRKKVSDTLFAMLIPRMLDNLPAPVRRFCAETEEALGMLQIQNSQLKNIAEWAFSGDEPRNLFLNNGGEILAASLVASCMKAMKLAVVDCDEKRVVFQVVTPDPGPGLVVYSGTNAQQAIALLDRFTWTNLKPPPPPTEQKSLGPIMRLSCSPSRAIAHCQTFLENNGFDAEQAAETINTLRKDALVRFSRAISVYSEQRYGYSYIKDDNTRYSYAYRGVPRCYDWLHWFGEDFSSGQLDRIFHEQPEGTGFQLGSITVYGYTAEFLSRPQQRAIRTAHDDSIKQLQSRNIITRESNLSIALGEVAGLIYALALSCVHLRCERDTQVRIELGTCYRSCLNAIVEARTGIARETVLGVLSCLWLGLPGILVSEWPQTALGISNSQGSIVSAILAESQSLQEATTKFVLSVDVPDMMVAGEPVVVCASYKRGTVDGRSHKINIKAKTNPPADACGAIGCLTICGGDAPQLSENRLANRALAVPIVGYIVCGIDWYDYVDLDQAFKVMENSQATLQPECTGSGCEQSRLAYWPTARDLLQPSHSDAGYTCCCAEEGDATKVVISTDGDGLKQALLCGLFSPTKQDVRFIGGACIKHALGDIIIA